MFVLSVYHFALCFFLCVCVCVLSRVGPIRT